MLTFGGRSADGLAKAAPVPTQPVNADFTLFARLDANALRLWMDVIERDTLRDRMLRLADKLDDPVLVDHPKWGEAWNRLTRMEGEMKGVLRRIADAKHCIERDYAALSRGGKDIVDEHWGLRENEESVAEFVVIEAECRDRLMPLVEVPF